MKTIRITLTKQGAQATCTHGYHFTNWPVETTWQGNRDAFKTPEGWRITCMDGIDNLQRQVAHQAALCGAKFTIEDLGGEALEWRDNVIFTDEESDSRE